MISLKGLSSPDGAIFVVDEDRLCYLVLMRKTQSLRAISRAIVDEYIDYFKVYPNNSSTQAREDLSGKSSVDKFEYGYSSSVANLAKISISLMNGQSRRSTPKKSTYQQIYFGAPGTGKSHTINEIVDKKNCVRTTFHPAATILLLWELISQQWKRQA